MGAKDVIAGLTASSAAELAAVELYERVNRRRGTVLAAAGRELETRS